MHYSTRLSLVLLLEMSLARTRFTDLSYDAILESSIKLGINKDFVLVQNAYDLWGIQQSNEVKIYLLNLNYLCIC